MEGKLSSCNIKILQELKKIWFAGKLNTLDVLVETMLEGFVQFWFIILYEEWIPTGHMDMRCKNNVGIQGDTRESFKRFNILSFTLELRSYELVLYPSTIPRDLQESESHVIPFVNHLIQRGP